MTDDPFCFSIITNSSKFKLHKSTGSSHSIFPIPFTHIEKGITCFNSSSIVSIGFDIGFDTEGVSSTGFDSIICIIELGRILLTVSLSSNRIELL